MRMIRTAVVATLCMPLFAGCLVKGRGFGSARQTVSARERVCHGFDDHRAKYTGPIGTLKFAGGANNADALLFYGPKHGRITVTKLVANLQKEKKNRQLEPLKKVVLVRSPTEMRRGQYLSFDLGGVYSVTEVTMEYKGGPGPKRGSRNKKNN